MDVGTMVALYGAVLSTAIGAQQLVTWRRDRPRLVIDCGLVWQPIGSDGDISGKGTPVTVSHGDDMLVEQVLVRFTIRNHGERALQIVGLVVESLEGDKVTVQEVTPHPLPHVLEPRTAVTVTMQKEFIDSHLALTFLGVVDAMGRRHSPKREEVRDLVEQCWALPTRFAAYKRRDDPTKIVRAFRAKDSAGLSQREIGGRSRRRMKPVVARAEFSQPSIHEA